MEQQHYQNETTTTTAAATASATATEMTASEPNNTKKIRPFPDRPFRPIAMLPMDHKMTQRYHRHEFVITEYIPGDVVMVVVREMANLQTARWFNEKNEEIDFPMSVDRHQACWFWLFELRRRLTIVGHVKEDEWVGVRGIVFKDKNVASNNNNIRFTDAFSYRTNAWLVYPVWSSAVDRAEMYLQLSKMKEEESANEKIRRDIAAKECMHVEALYSHNAPMCLEWCELHNNDEACFFRGSTTNNKKFVVTHMMQPTQRYYYTRNRDHDDDVEDALGGIESLLGAALSSAALSSAKDDDCDHNDDDDNDDNNFMPPLRPTAPALPASTTPVATPVATPILAAAVAASAAAALPPMPMLE